MLSDDRFTQWCALLLLSEQTKVIINTIRHSEPVRKVRGSGRNVVGPYSSKKVGRTIQFESHKVELPAIVQFYEHDNEVLEFWDQPIKFTIKCTPDGHKGTVVTHFPDFCVLRTDSCGFEEWKPEKTLIKRAQKYPYRYVCDEQGQWRDLIAQEYAEKLGFYYRLRLETEIDWVKYRNLNYLSGYKEGYLEQKYLIDEEVESEIKHIITSHPGINIPQLLQQIKTATIDDLNTLIATEKVYVDLSAVALIEQDRIHLFRDQETFQAYGIATHNYSQPVSNSVQILDIKVGTSFLLDGKSLTIEHIGDSKIILRGEQGIIRWTHAEFQQLVELKEVANRQTLETPSLEQEGWEYFCQASPKALEEANRRYEIISPYLKGDYSSSEKSDRSQRTIRNWKAKYKKAQQDYGCGLIGLIPQNKGNPNPRYSEVDLQFIDNIISEEYETFKQKNIWVTYEILKDSWKDSQRINPVPSHTFFYERIKKQAGYQQIKKRMGSRAANVHLGPWLIQQTTPPHGDRPFEIVHIDHTKLDLECICPYTGINLGRPWVTAMIDAYSRRILAVYVTFDPPSYRSCMMILRICVQRFGRFPEWLVVDNGKEFQSTYFDTLIARFEASKKHRPKDVPKFSSIIERWFGTQNTQFIDNLRGNTQITKHVRLVKKENNPKNLAVWELGEFYDYFAFGFSYGFYDQRKHFALEGFSPQEAFEFGLARTGYRPHQIIKYDQQFKILTMPTTTKGTAKVIPGTGVRINYQDYWTDEFYSVENQSIPIRYDPLDYGVAYAYVGNHWIQCISNYYLQFQGYSEKAVSLATTILRRKRQLHNQKTYVNANEIVHLLKNAEEYEELMLQLRRDWSTQQVHNLIEGQVNHPILHSNPVNHRVSEREEIVKNDGNDLVGDESEPSHKIDFAQINPYDDEELW